MKASRCEGLSMVLLEALACETPVIATNCKTGPSEIIENEKNGLLIPVEDEKTLKEAMGKLFYDKGLYKKLKANSSKSVEKYCIKNIAKDWINLFEEMHSLR